MRVPLCGACNGAVGSYSVDRTINTVVKMGSVCVRTKGRPFQNDRAVLRYLFLHLWCLHQRRRTFSDVNIICVKLKLEYCNAPDDVWLCQVWYWCILSIFQFKNKFLLSVYKSNDGEADFLTFVVCRDVLRTKQKQRSLLFLFWWGWHLIS